MRSPSLVRAICMFGTATAAGCMTTPVPGQAGHSDALSLQLAVLDARNEPADGLEMPRRPRLVLTAQPALDPAGPGPMLFEGPADPELLRDLERMPLTAASARRLVPGSIRYEDHTASLLPGKTLARGAVYTLAVPRTALPSAARAELSQVWTRALRTADTPGAGAAVSCMFPPDGAAGVATQLDFAVLAFDGSIDGIDAGIWLEDGGGWALPAEIESVPCATLETGADTCVRLIPERPLTELSRYTLHTGRSLRDAHGAEVEAVSASFSTGSEADMPRLGWQLGGCALDQTATAVGCALIGDHSIQLHIRPNAPARVTLQLDEQRVARLAGTLPVDVSFDNLEPDTQHVLLLTASAAGNETQAVEIALTTTTELATLSISEVLADPFGSEPAQEYIELVNYGAQPIALRGCSISDKPDELGTRIEHDATLPAGARALLVSNAFEIESPLDTPPAPGTMLVQVGAALTRSGLANAGEALFLRDPQQHRLSAAPAAPPPRTGVCNARVSPDPRSGAPGTFAYELELGCTPGR
jgi:hypothetical protein